MTDNWLELTIRFIVREHGIRDVKDAVSRAVLLTFERAGITVASATQEIIGVPPLRVELARGPRVPPPAASPGRTGPARSG